MRVTPAMEHAVERVLGSRLAAAEIARAMDRHRNRRSQSLLRALRALRPWMRGDAAADPPEADEIRAVLAARSAR